MATTSTNDKKIKPFLFPNAHSTLLPDPYKFFSPNLLSAPRPTNSFFQNLVLKNGDQPEYFHPYLIKSSKSSLSVSYPSRFLNSKLNNGQVWILYASSPIRLSYGVSEVISEPFSDIIRIALLPDSDTKNEAVLDRYSSCYPVSGNAVFTRPFCIEYKWEKKGS
ncbi:endo-13(4)-beta-glucanase 1-like, partial [Trifolium medium]|nr:endo-13(4)-beta-glucanase 1-like [Trifolium medium]